MKYVQRGTIQRKMSRGNSTGENFQTGGRLLSRGELFKGNCLGVVVFGGIAQG